MGSRGKLGLALLGIVGVAGCVGLATGAGDAGSAVGAGVVGGSSYTYIIDSAVTASTITYTTDGAGSTEQQSNVTLPFVKTIEIDGFGAYSISAQNGGGGAIRCQVLDENQEVIKTATSSGQYSIASCSGSTLD